MSAAAGGVRGAVVVAAIVALALPASARHKRAPPAAPPDAGPPAPAPQIEAPPEVPAGPSLVVLPLALDGGHDADVLRAGYAAEEAVLNAKHNALIALDDALDPTAAQARKKATTEGLRQLKAAHNAFEQLDMEVSSELANKAIGSLTKGDIRRNFPKVVDAFELRVATFASDPKTLDQAKVELGNLLPIDPRGELSPNLFNPDVIALAEGMRQKVKASSTLVLKVTTTPAPARVFVDGNFRGITPVDIPNLAPGNHYVSLIAPGFHQVTKRVNPGPDPQLAVTLEPAERAADLTALTAAVTAAFHAPKLDGPLSQVATALGADQALVIAVDAPGGKPARVYAERGTAQPPSALDDLDHAFPAAPADQLKAVDALVTDAVGRDHAFASQRIAPVAVAPPPSHGGGVRYAGIGVAGLGVVGAVVGTVFGLGANSDQANYKTTPQIDTTQSSQLRSDGQSKALLANVSFGTAIVAAGVGTAMILLGGPHAAAAESSSESSSSAAPSPSPSPSSPSSAPPTSPSSRSSNSTAPARSTPPPATSKSSSSSSSTSSPPPSSSNSSAPLNSSPSTPPPSNTSSPPPSSTSAPPPSTPSPAPPDSTTAKPPKDLGDDIKD